MKTYPISGILALCAALSLLSFPTGSFAQETKKMTTQQVYEEALRAYYRGDLVAAERGLRQVIQVDPRHSTARGYLAQVTHKLKTQDEKGGSRIEQNLAKVIVPSVDFKDATLESVLDFITEKTAELTNNEFRPNILYKGPAEELTAKKVTFKLANVPMTVVLQYIGEFTHTKFAYEKFAIVGTPERDTVAAEKPAGKEESSGLLSTPR